MEELMNNEKKPIISEENNRLLLRLFSDNGYIAITLRESTGVGLNAALLE